MFSKYITGNHCVSTTCSFFCCDTKAVFILTKSLLYLHNIWERLQPQALILKQLPEETRTYLMSPFYKCLLINPRSAFIYIPVLNP